MKFKKIIKYFEEGNVSVCGMRGRGKDLLMSNVAIRRELDYISNINYGRAWHPFDYELIDCGKNSYKNFIAEDVNYYEFDYPDGTDIYLSDAGVYFPSQYCSELNKDFRDMPVFQALSRHVGKCNFHFNSQNLNRVWDKIREQSDTYILCRNCIYLKGIDVVLQRITIYSDYQSALQRRKPLNLPMPLFANKEMKLQRKIQQANFEAQYGDIKTRWLIYKNKSNYDDRKFKEMLKHGQKEQRTAQKAQKSVQKAVKAMS